MSIEIRNLTHTYSEGTAMRTVALEDVCMTIEDGEFLGIIGHTGSGKSTLVQHLNGLLKPTSGQVFIDGEDLNGEHVNRHALRQRIGLVFQYPEYQLFEETVAKDIAFGPKNQGLSKEDIDERVRYAMDCVHLDYQKYIEPQTGIKAVCLPSTSPANAAWKTERLIEVWREELITAIQGKNK